MNGAAEKLKKLLANHCAPVLCRQKTANLVVTPRELAEYLPKVLDGSKTAWIQLCGCRKYCHLLLYDRERIESYLNKTEHQTFLEIRGYQGLTLSERLEILAKRYEAYQKRGGEFPHEIGLFLEYPLEDIEGFIANQGRNALECGYWKVYGNVEQAREIFELYDRTRKVLAAMTAAGLSLAEGAARTALQAKIQAV